MNRLLADENVSRGVVSALRRAGFDVVDLKQKRYSGLADQDILALAAREGRVIVTHDKDFADPGLFLSRKHPGVLLLRFPDPKPENVVPHLLRVLEQIPSKRFRNSVIEVGVGYFRRLGR